MTEPASIRSLGVQTARRAAFEVKTIVARYPALALPIARRRHGIPVGDDTDVVIEGFPRTGTSFAVAGFDMAQGGSVHIACHVHAPAQVIEGVRRRLPTLVIARDPEDTVVSFAIRNPHLSLEQGLRGYLRFYRPLLSRRDGFVVATFDEATHELGRVIARLNARFATSFAPFEHTQENVEAVFAAIDEDYRRRLPEGETLERQVARPSAWRERMKDEVRRAYEAPKLARLRLEAERAFGAIAPSRDA